MDARRRRLVVVASELVQILGGHSSARCEGMVRTKSRTERFSVALTLLEVELGLEEGARLEVEVVREWVVQRTLDAGLVGVVSAFEGCRCAGEDGRTVEDDSGVQIGGVLLPLLPGLDEGLVCLPHSEVL